MKHGKEGWLGLTPHRASEVMLGNVINIKAGLLTGGGRGGEEDKWMLEDPLGVVALAKEVGDGIRERKKQLSGDI